jgi:two-component system sensor histidine kinase/response regulator
MIHIGSDALTEIFKDFDGSVLVTATVDEAVSAVSLTPFDVFVLDEKSVGESETNLSESIRRHSKSDIKTILATSAMSATHETGHDSFDRVITKPIKRKIICEAVLELLGLVADSDGTGNLSETAPARRTGKRILLVEDSKANQMLAARIIEKAGYEFELASNGVEAVAQFTKKTFDLILMDIEMPEMDGFQATTEIRRIETDKQTPIIALTAHAIQGYHERCLAFGMNDYLTKPLRREQLLSVIERYLGAEPTGEGATNLTPEFTDVYIDRDIIDLIPAYLENCRESISEMKSSLESGDFAAIQRIGHNFKGSGRGYGFNEISIIGKSIEANARIGDSEAIQRNIAELEDYLSRIRVVED